VIDDACGWSGECAQLIFIADGKDAIAEDADPFSYAEVAIDGDDPAVDQDEIGGGRARQRRLQCGNGGNRWDQREQHGADHACRIAATVRPSKLPTGTTLCDGQRLS
jgi:hypothetical protein